jgi:BirA family biotin operon repressor/biotin-[acetyl-CoA-carboxylase] ligase
MQKKLQTLLDSLPLGGLRWFDTIGSTNDEALVWATEDAPDVSLVIADEQTAGRGRAGREWITPKGTALAFSLILRPLPSETDSATLFTGLGAVALADVLKRLKLKPRIKWPNDILLNGKKTAGILVESVWSGDQLDTVVLGMGVNVLEASTPPSERLQFPATSVEAELGRSVDRVDLLRDILAAILAWRPGLANGKLVKAWEEKLAYKGQLVQIWKESDTVLEGRVIGLEAGGDLRLLDTRRDKIVTVQFGEIHLRPSV